MKGRTMKQIPIILLIALFSIPMVSAQDEQVDDSRKVIKVNPASKARIKFIEDFFDFGSIPLNSVVAHDFPIKNEGTDTLVITEVKPTCGCTTAPMESNRIAPGEIEDLHVQLNTNKLNGLVRKFINIECSDPINPYMRISFRATINDPRQILIPIPNTADFGNVLKGEAKTVKVELQNSSDQDFDLITLSIPEEDIISIHSNKTALNAGETTELEFSLSDDTDAGPIFSSVTIEAEGKPGTRISIPIKGTIVE
jgi:hypothetical protein